MGTDYRNVRLTEAAYEKLRGRKREDESFSDVVERIAARPSLLELAGTFSDEEVDAIETALDEQAAGSRTALEAEWDAVTGEDDDGDDA